MKFRKLYWVTEQLDVNGLSEVTGVFTSVPDLIRTGLGIQESATTKQAGYRLSLMELDKNGLAFLQWSSLHPEPIEELLEPFAKSGELTRDEISRLADALARASA